ncbi:MAG: hypothetical protein HOV71_27705 [Hamadaea sp.]|nr:hypothetical protein [Hamadaea sp.]NUR51929.1 hypothetical protein [Hamadaea sp.]
MITELRDALRAEAGAVPAYAVYERAVRTARRRRRTRWGAYLAAAAVLAILATSGVPGALLADPPPIGSVDGRPSIPDRLAFPPAFWPSVTGSPPGPASVLFGGTGFAADRPLRLLDNEGDLAVVGATSDVYRMMRVGFEVHAGEEVLLSPDGNSLAVPSSFDLRAGILDLSTGEETRLTGFSDTETVTPLAWSPDGHTLAVKVVPGGPERSQFGLVDLPGGAIRKSTSPFGFESMPGFDAAFSPDGRLFAYAADGEIVVVRSDLTELARITTSGRAWLAGKGAWAPDGRLMTWEITDDTWRLRGVDLATRLPGYPPLTSADPEWTVTAPDLAAVRLLGWTGGQPIVAVYQREPSSTVGPPATYYQDVHSVAVWRLTATGHQVLLTAPHNLMSIDIADAALATGEVRAADPPRFGIVTVLAVVVPVTFVVALGWALVRRGRRTARRRGTAPSS